MLKQNKKFNLTKNYEMVVTNQITMPSVVQEKDIFSLFSGLMMMVKTHAKKEAEKDRLHSDFAYEHLLKMYLESVKKMNKYKAMLKERNIAVN